jgi:PAS domain S-box-containing protein
MISATTKTILLVEDEALIAMSEKLILERYGYQVRVASNGEKAIEAALSFPEIDLILMDINLGSGMDGTQAAVEILGKRDLPLAFLSSHSEREVVEKTEGITSYGYILKNSGETVLIASVKMAFRLFEAKLNEKAKEEKLRVSDRFFNHAIDLLCVAGFDGYFKVLNPSWERILGWSTRELLEKPWIDFVHPDDKDRTSDIRTTLIDGREVYQFENRYICKNGDVKWLSWNSFPYPEDGIMFGVARDVTEKKKMEEALKESEQTFKALFEKGPIGVAYHQMVYSEDGKPVDYRFIAANKSYQSLTGVDPTGKLVTEAFPGIEKDPYDWIGTYGRVARTGEEIRFQQHLEANDRWYDCVGYQYKPDHFVAAFLEITEQKKAERELFAQKEHLRVTLRSIGDAVIATDVDGRVDFLNEVAERLTGWSQDRAKGRTLTEVFRIVNAFTRQQCENPVDKALREGTIVGLANHTVLISDTGKEYQIADSAAPIRDSGGTIIGVVLVFRDVSDEYHLEAALRSSESELKKAQEVAKLGSWIWYIQDNRLVWSDQMFSIFGLDRDRFSGKLTEVIASSIHPDDRAKVEHSNNSVMTAKQPIPLEYRIVRPDGVVRHVWAEAGELVVDEDGKPAVLRGIVQDITDKKHAEEKINKLLQGKELLLKETHHRIKNNMGLIYSLLALQAAAVDGGDPRSILNDAAGRVRSMMLLYDRLYRGEQFGELNARSFLVSLIADIVQLFPAVPAVRVEEKIGDIILGAKTISTLGIIINELITNSMKYAFPGRECGLIVVEATRTGNQLRIVYSDDGVGLPESVGRENSTGFGMQLIHLLVQQLEGSTRIDRTQGTRFLFEFPV